VYIPRVVDLRTRRGLALAAALVPFSWTLAGVLRGGGAFTVLTWIGALGFVIYAIPGDGADPSRRRTSGAGLWWRILVVLLPVFVRLASLRVDRIHGDDLITAYFSTRYNLWRTDFFAPVPPNPGDWVSQFPAPFFALQKLFFVVFGETLLTVKLSILPYVLLVSGLLYAIARELVDERAATLAVVLYAFFGPSVYLETLGLHFVSSTAVFLAFFYVSLLELRGGTPRHALLAGMAAGACYLFYLSSYLALPIAALFFLARGAPERERRISRSLALFTLGLVMVLAPFAGEALQKPNALLRRFEQVSLIGGEWAYPQRNGHEMTIAQTLRDNELQSLQSIYRAGIGGSGGYDFGKQALLEPLGLSLLALGALRAIVLARRKIEWALVLAVTALFFFVNVGLSIPPPGFHRCSIGFPFLCLLFALPLHALLEAASRSIACRAVVVAAVVVAFAATQTWYARSAMLLESDFEDLRLARFIDAQFPGRPLYVAAFPTYAFERFYHFARTGGDRRVISDYHSTLLENFDARRKYLYIVTLPDAFDAQFAERDPRGRLIHFSPRFSVFVN
jgi:hypothetical protein